MSAVTPHRTEPPKPAQAGMISKFKDDPEILDVFGDSSLDIFLTKWWEIIQNPLRAPNHTRK